MLFLPPYVPSLGDITMVEKRFAYPLMTLTGPKLGTLCFRIFLLLGGETPKGGGETHTQKKYIDGYGKDVVSDYIFATQLFFFKE